MKICTTEQEYINEIASSVQRVCKRYGYIPSVLIGQSCLENGYGIRSYWDNPQIEALLTYNNMVGIKSELLNKSWDEYTVWTGESLTKQTPEVYNGKQVTITDNFRKYDAIERAFADFLLFITYASNYGKGGTPKYGTAVTSLKDPEALIKKVNALGYATGTTYATNVMKIVNKHNLIKYDDLSNVEPTIYTPGYKDTSSTTTTKNTASNIVTLTKKTINDITSRNKSQIPASRGSNPIKFIVCHYLGVPNADNPDLYGGGYGGHYNIQRDGQIFLAANPKTDVVWQCGGGLQGSGGHSFYQVCTNYNSIGIECGVCYTDTSAKDGDGDNNKWYFTETTQKSLVYLVSKLMDEYNISIDHVIRHYDVTGKICPNPYVKNNGLNGNWTWDEFINNVKQYRSNGTITIPNKSANPFVSTTTKKETSSSRSYLQKGDKGEDVKQMQMMLIACGYSCGSCGADGDFGSGTLSALKSFQTDQKLTVDGLYGVNTKNALTAMYEAKTSSTTAKSNTVFNGLDYSPVYNYSYYKKKYDDLKKAFGSDEKAYFNHFCVYGMKEGRQASSSFNVQNYKARYSDLRKVFGNNLPLYYKHYLEFGISEKRNAK